MNNRIVLPLTSSQQGIFFDQLRLLNNPCYNEGTVGEINVDVDPSMFRKAVNQMVHFFDILTVDFKFDGDELLQYFGVFDDILFEFIDLSKSENSRAVADEMINAHFSVPYVLGQDRLFETRLYKIADKYFLFEVKFHHIVCDAFGLSLMFYLLGDVYKSVVNNEASTRPEGIYPFKDEIAHDINYLSSPQYQKDKTYWNQKFALLPTPLLPRVREQNPFLRSHRLTVTLPADIRSRLDALTVREKLTYQQLGICAISICFSNMQQRDQLVFGIPIHRRRTAAQKGVLATFTSDLPCCFDVATCNTLSDVFNMISAELRRSYRFQSYPKAHLSRDLRLMDKGVDQIAEVFFNFQHFTTFPLLDGHINFLRLSSGFEQDPLHIRMCYYGDEQPIKINFDFRDEYMSLPEGEMFAARFIHVLDELSKADVNSGWKDISVFTGQDAELLIAAERGQSLALPFDSVISAFKHQLRIDANATLLVDGEHSYTYAELDRRSLALASELRRRGLQSEEPVVVALPRGVHFLVAILAIMRSGGCYVPLSSHQPTERIRRIISDVHPRFCLTAERRIADLIMSWQVIDPAANVGNSPDLLIPTELPPESLAYLIYTSGSSGVPKGVMIEHRQLASLLYSMQQKLEISPQDRVLASTSITFDIHLLEWLLPLVAGACVISAPTDLQQEPERILAMVKQEQLTFVQATPSGWSLLLDAGFVPDPKLMMLCGGERLTESLRKRLSAPTCKLWNMYGPTETTIWSACNLATSDCSIGLPIANTEFRVLDPAGQTLPVGAVGELYIGGAGVARGYWKQSEIAGSAFVTLAEASSPVSQRYYRTGDAVRWGLDDAGKLRLHYLERLDEQVKIRGHRIEPAEIEFYARQHPAVNDARVVSLTLHDSPFLTMYVIPANPEDSRDNLFPLIKAFLALHLPEFMLPKYLELISGFPLTPNGKLDKRALPVPTSSSATEIIVAPVNDDEFELVMIWSDLLHLPAAQISTAHSFFSLGGDSLSLVKLKSLIRQVFHIDIAVPHLFELRTISDISSEISRLRLTATLLHSADNTLTVVDF